MLARVGWAALAAVAVVALGGCSSHQVIVHLDENPNDLTGAQQVADARCRSEGRRARFLMKVYNDAGPRDAREPRPPDAIFICDPAS